MPLNVTLSSYSDDKYFPNSSLLVKLNITKGLPEYLFRFNFVSKNLFEVCSSYPIDIEFNTTTSIDFIAGPPTCSLAPSTLYNATVQIKNTVNSASGPVSLPSNNQATGKTIKHICTYYNR